MDVIFDWNLGNMIYNSLITLRLCGFPFVEIGVVSEWTKDKVALSQAWPVGDGTINGCPIP